MQQNGPPIFAKTPKSVIHEFYQLHAGHPVFNLDYGGPPSSEPQQFICKLICPEVSSHKGSFPTQTFTGAARSKKGAEHAAALQACEFLVRQGFIAGTTMPSFPGTSVPSFPSAPTAQQPGQMQQNLPAVLFAGQVMTIDQLRYLYHHLGSFLGVYAQAEQADVSGLLTTAPMSLEDAGISGRQSSKQAGGQPANSVPEASRPVKSIQIPTAAGQGGAQRGPATGVNSVVTASDAVPASSRRPASKDAALTTSDPRKRAKIPPQETTAREDILIRPGPAGSALPPGQVGSTGVPADGRMMSNTEMMDLQNELANIK